MLPTPKCHPLQTWLSKRCAVDLAPYLTTLFNLSLRTATFPASMKIATVKPLLKKINLDNCDIKNYRPVSNLTFISKLLERAVSKQIMDYLENNSLLPTCQSAYRVAHSTETALLKIFSDLTLAADSGQISLVACLDLSAAFDCVDHEILIQRLHREFGMAAPVTSWIASYLHDRKQFIKCTNSSSMLRTLNCGVPQGSVLGPLLFLIFTADIERIVRSRGLSAHVYADDIQAYGSCIPSEQGALRRSVLDCIEDVTTWMSSNRLKLNPTKTDFLLCATPQIKHLLDHSPFIINTASITPSPSVRLLGVIIDSELNMSAQVNSMVSTCFYHLRRLRTIRRSLPLEASKTLINAFIVSRLDYCNGLLAGLNNKQLDRLQRIMHVAAKLVHGGGKYDHVTELLRDKLHWLRMPQRITYKLCLMVHKALYHRSPAYIRDLVVPTSRNAVTRRLRGADTMSLIRPRTRVLIGDRSFAAAGPTAWNNLPAAMRKTQSLITFKSALKTHLFKISYD